MGEIRGLSLVAVPHLLSPRNSREHPGYTSQSWQILRNVSGFE